MSPGRRHRGLAVLAPLFALTLASTSAGQTPPHSAIDDVNGRWELRGRWNSEAVSQIIELLSGGWYSATLVASVNLQYQYNGADLVLVGLNKNGAPDLATKAVLHVRFDEDTLTLTSASDTIKMLRAAGGEFTGDIKGRWRMLTGDAEHAVTQEFAGDGSLRVITTLSGEVGRYRITGNEIEWSPMLPARASRKTNYKLQNEKLVLWAGALRDELVRLR
ncbi:MAG TPA: hypothetical protein VM099_15840 [Gemmatimonadaceae bacterium]|nr:hypothetical protein [Gemmatimonadaceae bacterium]